VLMGERYKIVSNEVRQYLAGFYGRPPAPINEEVRRKVLGKREPITDRPADHIEPEMVKARAEAAALGGTTEEDALAYALFPQPAKDFFEWRAAGGGPEPEVVAAVAAALAAVEPPKPVAAATPTGANGAAPGGSFSEAAWRYAHRTRGMRG
jgi:pyruvate/oxaloacetate carboxyltransferase